MLLRKHFLPDKLLFLAFLELFQKFLVNCPGCQQVARLGCNLFLHARVDRGRGNIGPQTLEILIHEPAFASLHERAACHLFFRRLHLVFKILQMPPAVLKRFFRGSKAHFGFFFQMGPVVKRFLQFKLERHCFFGTKWIFYK